MWTARRILKELADADRRKRVAAAFWKNSDQQSRAVATVQLAKALHFRDETLRKLPLDRRAELLASRIGAPEFEQTFDAALMHYHTHEQREMLAAFLDAWHIPHENGSIETDDYTTPTADQVRDAVRGASSRFDPRDVVIYLASAGLLMGADWQAVMWPVVDEMAPTLE